MPKTWPPLQHLRPLLYRIEKLGGKDTKEIPQDMEDIMAREVSFSQLQRALQVLDNDSSHAMTTDRQLMLVLRTLAKKSPETDDECISWAEFYQCYKTVVAGMQTLQYVPSQSLVRSRTKDRTLTILSMFEPPSTKLFNEDVPRTIQTGANEALEEDRHHARPEVRRKRRIGVVAATFLAVAALLLCIVFLQSPQHGNSMIDLWNTISNFKTAAASWMPEGMMMTEVPRQPLAPHRDAFFHHISASTPKDAPLTDSMDVVYPITVQKNDSNTAVAVLAGASGVAVAPMLLKVAALIPAGGIPAITAVTLFTVGLAPVIKGVDVMVGRLLHKVKMNKKQ